MEMYRCRFSTRALPSLAVASVSILALASPAAALVCGVAFTYPVVGGTVTVDGAGSTTPTTFSLACGNNADATTAGLQGSNIAVGAEAIASGNDSANIAVGGKDAFVGFAGTTANGANAFNIAIGSSANATGSGTISFSQSTFSNNIAVGTNANASGSNGSSNIAIGLNTTASGNAFALGVNANAPGARSIAFGSAASTFNSATSAGAHDAVAIGTSAKASGSSSTAMGNRSAASARYSAALGTDASASGIGAMALGTDASAKAASTVALGNLADATGGRSIAIGLRSTASAADAVALGSGSVADTAHVVSVGAAGHERRIVNVRAATNPTDAVNLQQVKSLIAAASHMSAAVLPGIIAAANNGSRGERLASLSDPATHSPSDQRSAVTSQPVASLSCEFGAAGVTTAASEQSNATSTFALVQQSGISFRQGGSAAGCTTVSVAAEVQAPGRSAMEVRAVLDGGVEASPGPVVFTQEGNAFHARAFTFLFANVPPGTHRVDIQFRNAGEKGSVRIGHRTIVAQFAK